MKRTVCSPTSIRALAAALSVVCVGAIASDVRAQGRADTVLEGVDVRQKLGEKLPLELAFVDEAGRTVRLGDYFGDRPVVLALVYYECPMLCTLVLNGLSKALKPLSLDVGEELEVVVVSFDPGETPALAAAKKAAYVAAYGRPKSAGGWHFLTGAQAEIERLTEAVGFEYSYDPVRDEYAHAAAIMVATPDGRLARYFFGVEYSARDLRLGLVEASDGDIGTLVDKLLLYCYHYDPSTGRYSAVAMNVVRLGGAATVTVLGLFIWIMLRRERRDGRA